MGAVEFVSIALPAIFWPIAVVLFTWWQRKPIGRLIDRIRGGRAFGAEFDAPPPDLAEAVQGGASSPEVEELIRSASAEVEETPSSGEESSRNAVLDSMARADAAASRSLLERLTLAQHQDEGRRRSDIERVMKSAARWGAKLARNAPNDPDAWEPVVRWNDNGEPEVTARRRTDFLDRTRYDLMHAENTLAATLTARDQASHAYKTASEALHRSTEPSNELRDRVSTAAVEEQRTDHQVQQAHAEVEDLRSSLAWMEGT